jgi:hypothetical protein
MVDRLKRLSVAIDEDTNRVLEELAKSENRTVSEIIRNAIGQYYILKDVSPEGIKFYSELMYGREYIVLDIELWIAILDELNEKASEDFWTVVSEIAEAHSWQIGNKGLNSLYEVMKYLERYNLFRVKTDGKNIILILSSRNEQRFIKTYVQSLLRNLGIKVRIAEGLRKLYLTEEEK